jgi:prepilin-type N-terminal cleavage/methylation domain-containing protein
MRHNRRETRDERRGTRDVVHHPSSIVLRQCRGFTFVELLLVLVISSILLAAVAVAFNASVINYQENEDIFKTINNARQALCRMTSQLRTGHWVDPAAPSNQCSFYTADADGNEPITYDYRSADNKLYLVTNGNAYVLCDNVTAATFTKTPDGSGDCKSVQISITVQSGPPRNMQRTLSAAVVIRRNLV